MWSDGGQRSPGRRWMRLNPNVCLFRFLRYELGAVCRAVDLNSVSFDKNRLACILHKSFWNTQTVDQLRDLHRQSRWSFPTTHELNTDIMRHSSTTLCVSVCVYVWSHACCRHCAAVALRSGWSSNMVNKKSLNWAAWSSGHSYFSRRTSNRPHGFRLEMWRSSPETGTHTGELNH